MATTAESNDKGEPVEATEEKSPWDNDLPAGDSPPGPRWHLPAAAAAWGAWVLFLLVMALQRVTSDPR